MLRLIAGALVLALTAPVWADQPSFSFAGAAYQRVELDDLGLNIDGNGLSIGGSFEVGDNWHVFGSYSSTDFGLGIDVNELQVGAGYHVLISDNTSFFTDLSLVRAEVDVGILGSVDDDGYGLTIGMRSNVSERFEAEGYLSYVDLGNGADGLAVGGAGWYRLSDSFAIGLLVIFDEDVVAYGIGGRYYFGS